MQSLREFVQLLIHPLFVLLFIAFSFLFFRFSLFSYVFILYLTVFNHYKPSHYLQELAALSEKSTGQSKTYEGKIKDMETAMEERKHTLEKIEIARDDLTIQLRKLEQSLQEKDLRVEVITFIYDLNIYGLRLLICI